METKRLKEVAVLRSGYPFRSRIESVPGGGCSVVQMKDLRALGTVAQEYLLQIESPANVQEHLLRTGDVLLVARGVSNRAVSVSQDLGVAVPASNLFILRPHSTLLPEYLVAFLSLPGTQSHLRAMQTGSSIPFLPLRELEDLAIPVPSLEIQKRIAEIHCLSTREQELLDRLKLLRRTLVDASLQYTLRHGAQKQS